MNAKDLDQLILILPNPLLTSSIKGQILKRGEGSCTAMGHSTHFEAAPAYSRLCQKLINYDWIKSFYAHIKQQYWTKMKMKQKILPPAKLPCRQSFSPGPGARSRWNRRQSESCPSPRSGCGTPPLCPATELQPGARRSRARTTPTNKGPLGWLIKKQKKIDRTNIFPIWFYFPKIS